VKVARRYRQRALDHADPADEMRRIIARWCLKDCLFKEDPRVWGSGRAWFSTDEAARFLEQYISASRDDDQLKDTAWTSAQAAVSGRLRKAFAPFDGPRWLWDSLAFDIVGTALHAVIGNTYTITFQLSRAWNTRLQRKSKSDHATVSRDVRWFYRSRIKQPPDSIAQLARAYTAARKAEGAHISAAKTTVKDGIRRAAAFLGLD
jgi:hypothetical protein